MVHARTVLDITSCYIQGFFRHTLQVLKLLYIYIMVWFDLISIRFSFSNVYDMRIIVGVIAFSFGPICITSYSIFLELYILCRLL